MNRLFWTTLGSTTLFVLLWSSGGIFSRLGLDHASPFAFLTLRFAIALSALVLLGALRRESLPPKGARASIAATGALLIGAYSICYLLALDHGVTPGVLATVLGVQPILTALIVERRLSALRMTGLALALSGLVCVVYPGIESSRVQAAGMLFALASLISMTSGAILQKRLTYAPMQALPLQYAVSLLMCLLFAPFKPLEVEFTPDFLVPLLWLGLCISVIAQLLLYRLIRAGNLVNVTSLFYLVPAVTAAMDYVFLGNAMSRLSLAGMAAILLGLSLVFRTTVRDVAPEKASAMSARAPLSRP